MNELIESILGNLYVNGVFIPVSFLYYEDDSNTYIVYSQQDADNSFSGDDDLLGYVDYYDFDVYSKRDPTEIVETLKDILKANGFVWQPSRSSGDMYESETGFYHKTLNFAFLKEINEGGIK